MKIAVIGAGLAGLGVSYFLLENKDVEVTLFDQKGIGGGASGVCSGLLHPYPGMAARRSCHADEALRVAKGLIQVAEKSTPLVVAHQNGIWRHAQSPEQRERLNDHVDEFGDIESVDGERFLIHSGITVSLDGYLDGLWKACSKRGAILKLKKIESLEELKSFDQIIVAAGWGVREFFPKEELGVKFMKGQTLLVEGAPPFERSFISKGYIAHLGLTNQFEVGSTYEREFVDDQPDLPLAQKLLEQNLSVHAKEGKIIGGKAGVRVLSTTHYLPIIKKMDEKNYVFTGLGSRGLLYHGYYGRQLANTLLSNNRDLL